MSDFGPPASGRTFCRKCPFCRSYPVLPDLSGLSVLLHVVILFRVSVKHLPLPRGEQAIVFIGVGFRIRHLVSFHRFLWCDPSTRLGHRLALRDLDSVSLLLIGEHRPDKTEGERVRIARELRQVILADSGEEL